MNRGFLWEKSGILQITQKSLNEHAVRPQGVTKQLDYELEIMVLDPGFAGVFERTTPNSVSPSVQYMECTSCALTIRETPLTHSSPHTSPGTPEALTTRDSHTVSSIFFNRFWKLELPFQSFMSIYAFNQSHIAQWKSLKQILHWEFDQTKGTFMKRSIYSFVVLCEERKEVPGSLLHTCNLFSRNRAHLSCFYSYKLNRMQ